MVHIILGHEFLKFVHYFNALHTLHHLMVLLEILVHALKKMNWEMDYLQFPDLLANRSTLSSTAATSIDEPFVCLK